MKPAPFEYVRAESVEQAVRLLADYEGMARLLAGGQSLVPMLHMRLMRPAVVIDVNDIAGLDEIVAAGSQTRIGALVRYSTLESDPLVGERLPLLKNAVRHVGDRQVRNRGTIGGSVAHADPTGELPLVALALDATVVAHSVRGAREVAVDDLLEGAYTTTLAPDEMITEVRFPAAPHACTFAEVNRKHNDFAVLAVAAAGTPRPDGGWTGMRVALAGVNDRPVLAAQASELLEGTRLWTRDVDAAAEACLEVVDAPSDVRASEEYRRHLVGVHVRRALTRLRDERTSVHV